MKETMFVGSFFLRNSDLRVKMYELGGTFKYSFFVPLFFFSRVILQADVVPMNVPKDLVVRWEGNNEQMKCNQT